MIEGITAGFILSLSLFPGTVWLARVGCHGRLVQILAVGLGFWLSQLLWVWFAIPGLMLMCRQLSFLLAGMHVFAAFVLAYMAIKFFRTRRVESLAVPGPLSRPGELFHLALVQALAMPMRLPAAMAILLATGVYINHPPVWDAQPSILFGALIGVTWWWGQFTFLALVFAKRVPEPITLRSLNRIRPFCGLLFCGLTAVVLFLGL